MIQTKVIINITSFLPNTVLALASGELSCEQTTVIKMKTNKEAEVQLIKNVDGKGQEDFKVSNTEDFDATVKGN